MRFPQLPLVTDFGFTAADLRQGGVGDCWFLSALAVVAERHDLIERLFTDTARNEAGCYQARLFLDGKWQSIIVDDMLPVTDEPRRVELAFESKLAFSRCGSSVGGQQLWVSILEKAYAKAHGSFQAVSHRAADCFIDLECLRLVSQQAAINLNTNLDCENDALVAKIWAGNACHRISYSAQHLHGGVGVDKDYVLWRYCLLAKECELINGSASQNIDRLGLNITANQ